MTACRSRTSAFICAIIFRRGLRRQQEVDRVAGNDVEQPEDDERDPDAGSEWPETSGAWRRGTYRVTPFDN